MNNIRIWLTGEETGTRRSPEIYWHFYRTKFHFKQKAELHNIVTSETGQSRQSSWSCWTGNDHTEKDGRKMPYCSFLCKENKVENTGAKSDVIKWRDVTIGVAASTELSITKFWWTFARLKSQIRPSCLYLYLKLLALPLYPKFGWGATFLE